MDGNRPASGQRQREGRAIGCRQRPALAGHQRRQLQLVQLQPQRGVGVVLRREVDAGVRPDVAVHPPRLAAVVVTGGDFDRDALADVSGPVAGGEHRGRGDSVVHRELAHAVGGELRVHRLPQRDQNVPVAGGVQRRLVSPHVRIVHVGDSRIVQVRGRQKAELGQVEQVPALRQGRHRDAAGGRANALVRVADRGVHVVVDLVEGQRQADRQGDAGRSTNTDCQRSGTGDGVDARRIVGHHFDAVRGDPGRSVAVDRRRHVRLDLVFRVHAGGTDGDADLSARTQPDGPGQHDRVDVRGVGSANAQVIRGVRAGTEEQGPHLPAIGAGVDVPPQPRIAVLLGLQIEQLHDRRVRIVGQRLADVLVDIAGERAGGDVHLLARLQDRERRVVRVVVRSHGVTVRIPADEVARDAHADRHARTERARTNAGRDRQRTDEGRDGRVAASVDVHRADGIGGAPDRAAGDDPVRAGRHNVRGLGPAAAHRDGVATTCGHGHGSGNRRRRNRPLVERPDGHVPTADRAVRDLGRHVRVDGVVRQRQADRHADGRPGAGRDRHRTAGRHGEDLRRVSRGHGQATAGIDGTGVDRRVRYGVDPVERAGHHASHTDAAAALAAADGDRPAARQRRDVRQRVRGNLDAAAHGKVGVADDGVGFRVDAVVTERAGQRDADR